MIKNPLVVLAIAGLTSLLVGGLFFALLGTSLISLIIEFLAVLATFFGLAWLLPKSKEDLEKEAIELNWQDTIATNKNLIRRISELGSEFTSYRKISTSIESIVNYSRLILKDGIDKADIVKLTKLKILLEDLAPALESMAELASSTNRSNLTKRQKVLTEFGEKVVELEGGLETLTKEVDDAKENSAKLKMAAIKATLASAGLSKHAIDVMADFNEEEKTK